MQHSSLLPLKLGLEWRLCHILHWLNQKQLIVGVLEGRIPYSVCVDVQVSVVVVLVNPFPGPGLFRRQKKIPRSRACILELSVTKRLVCQIGSGMWVVQ